MRTRLVLAGLAGAVVALGVELVQTKRVVDAVQHEGVTVHAPVFGQDLALHLQPHGGGGEVLELPADAKATLKNMHKVAAAAAAATAVAVLVATIGD